MQIKDIQKKYKLNKDIDFWKHAQSGKWVLKHNACEKIASMEKINIVNIQPLNSTETLVRFLVTGKLGDKAVTTVGEADTKNCRMSYLGCMAEKRGIDRCILKLINAYEYDIVSEEEADDWKYQVQYPTEEMRGRFDKLISHKAFDGGHKMVKDKWKTLNTHYLQEDALKKMEEEIERFKKVEKESINQDEKLNSISQEVK